MAIIKAFYYDNEIKVQIHVDDPVNPAIPTIRTENRTMYNRQIKIFQGIDNPLTVRILNQDQKKVDMSAYSIQVDIQDPLNEISVGTYAVTLTDAISGIGKFTIPKADVDALTQRIYKMTIKCATIPTSISPTSEERPLYLDDNYDVRIDLIVQPGWY